MPKKWRKEKIKKNFIEENYIACYADDVTCIFVIPLIEVEMQNYYCKRKVKQMQEGMESILLNFFHSDIFF